MPTSKILNCENCGDPFRGVAVRFYLPDGTAIIVCSDCHDWLKTRSGRIVEGR